MENNNRYLAVSALVIKDEKLLLLKRAEGIFGAGNFCLPSGHVENNESIKAALIRELYEEVGIIVDPYDEEAIKLIHVLHSRNVREYINFFFVINKYDGECYNKEPSIHDYITWVSCHDLPQNVLNRQAICESLRGGLCLSLVGW